MEQMGHRLAANHAARGVGVSAHAHLVIEAFEHGLGLKGLRIDNLKFVLPPPPSQYEEGESSGDSICWLTYAEPPAAALARAWTAGRSILSPHSRGHGRLAPSEYLGPRAIVPIQLAAGDCRHLGPSPSVPVQLAALDCRRVPRGDADKVARCRMKQNERKVVHSVAALKLPLSPRVFFKYIISLVHFDGAIGFVVGDARINHMSLSLNTWWSG